LNYLPEFSLAVLMIFTGWKMVAGLYHVAEFGHYEFGLALFCGILVFRLGIFEGLIISLVIHSFIQFVVYRHHQTPIFEILRKFIVLFSSDIHPHGTATMVVAKDQQTGGLRYSSLRKHVSDKKELDDFIQDWGDAINQHQLMNVVSTYDANGLLWGTFAKDLRIGHGQIKKYFEHLFELKNLKVSFEHGETRQYNDIFIRSGSYCFSYTKKDLKQEVRARYSFVCKKENSAWFIVEHHSSEFPA
jgi:hypothetical protein